MAIADIATFHSALPEAFEKNPLPSILEDIEEWDIVRIDDPDYVDADPLGLEDSGEQFVGAVSPWEHWRDNDNIDRYSTGFGQQGEGPGTPGGLITSWRGKPIPPPDALAFYLPFHLYAEPWWGIYLIREGVEWLARELCSRGKTRVGYASAYRAARTFLYGHEQFHHVVESFATRLEVTHRVPLYRLGMNTLYERLFDTDKCMEEALANAHGYQKVLRVAKTHMKAGERKALLASLLAVIKDMPPGYRLGGRFVETKPYNVARGELSEDYQMASLSAIPRMPSSIWRSFGHAFQPIANIRSRVNYLVRAGSPLAQRAQLDARHFRYRKVERALRDAGCTFVREGKGSHMIWRCRDGTNVSVPRHTREMKKGLLRDILRSAGIDLPMSQLGSAFG